MKSFHKFAGAVAVCCLFYFSACGGDSGTSSNDDSNSAGNNAGAVILDESSDSEDVYSSESSEKNNGTSAESSATTAMSSETAAESSDTSAESSETVSQSANSENSSSSVAGEMPGAKGIEGCSCAPESDPLYSLTIEANLKYVVSGCKSSTPISYAWCNASGSCQPARNNANYTLIVGQNDFVRKLSVVAINETDDSLKVNCTPLKEFKVVKELPSSSSVASSSSSIDASSSSVNATSSSSIAASSSSANATSSSDVNASSSSANATSSSSIAVSSSSIAASSSSVKVSSSSARSSSSVIKSITGCKCTTDSPDTVWVDNMDDKATVTYHLSGCKPSQGVLYNCPGVTNSDNPEDCATITAEAGVGGQTNPSIRVSVGEIASASVYAAPKCKVVKVAKRDANLKYIKPSGTYNCGIYDCVTTKYLNQTMLADGKYGEVLDERDNKVYKTIEIPGIYPANGERRNFVWMAQNLNYYKPSTTPSLVKSKSKCQGDSVDNCTEYGRTYTWGAATDSIELAKTMGRPCGDTLYSICKLSTRQIRGVCPEGFHIPTNNDYKAIENYIQMTYYSNKGPFKSTNGNWWHGNQTPDDASDDVGFSLVATSFGHGSANDIWHSKTSLWTRILNSESGYLNGKQAYTFYFDNVNEDLEYHIGGGAVFDYACTNGICNVKQEFAYLRCVLDWEY